MRPSLKIALPVIPLSLNVVWFSVFELTMGTRQTDRRTDGRQQRGLLKEGRVLSVTFYIVRIHSTEELSICFVCSCFCPESTVISRGRRYTVAGKLSPHCLIVYKFYNLRLICVILAWTGN